MDDTSIAVGHDERAVLIGRVKLISWLSLVWMSAEGVIGTTAGIMANSIALIGYGVDSTITGIASVIIIWRFSGDRVDSDHAEARARKIVAITFFLLAPTSSSRRSTTSSPEARHRSVGSASASPSSVSC
ncbi:hypothetical protein BH20ACT14_BH20ACT14_17630 [soil metagenome]